MLLPKHNYIRSKAILTSANGETCTICGINDGTIVFCHLNESWAGKGTRIKADDIAGFYGCFKCHKKYDEPKFDLILDITVMRAMYRTWKRLIEKNIITING